MPTHLRGLLGTRPAYGEGALYPLFSTMWRNYTYKSVQDEEDNCMRRSVCSDCPTELDVSFEIYITPAICVIFSARWFYPKSTFN